MLLLYILIAAAIIATGVIFALTKLGKITDVDRDGIPDVIEEKIEDAKYRAQRIKEEVGDVVEASKEVIAQIKDIKGAAKGETRKGRKKQ
jgi:hypothetical protein